MPQLLTNSSTRKIKLVTGVMLGGKYRAPGETVEVPIMVARNLVMRDRAVPLDQEERQSSTGPTPKELRGGRRQDAEPDGED